MIDEVPSHYRRGKIHMIVNGGIAPLHDLKHNVWRVPIKKVNNEYKVWVAPNYFRIFDKQTLPDAVKSRLAIIHARSCRLAAYGGVDFEASIDDPKPLYGLLYLSEDVDGMEDTGWRVNEDYYTVVIPDEDMTSLRGETINNDPRSKS
jgi:hypothetical protein